MQKQYKNNQLFQRGHQVDLLKLTRQVNYLVQQPQLQHRHPRRDQVLKNKINKHRKDLRCFALKYEIFRYSKLIKKIDIILKNIKDE